MKELAWTQTYTGKKFFTFNPKPEQIDIHDIAHALSRMCRYNGHCRDFVSVALHSLNVHWLLEEQGYNDAVQMYGLLHDASEAYIADIPAPAKEYMPEYRAIEDNIMHAVFEKVGLPDMPEHIAKAVKKADLLVLKAEALESMGDISEWELIDGEAPKLAYTSKMPIECVEKLFLICYADLKEKAEV